MSSCTREVYADFVERYCQGLQPVSWQQKIIVEFLREFPEYSPLYQSRRKIQQQLLAKWLSAYAKDNK